MIELENVSKFFDTFKAVDRVTFQMKKGEVVGFLGPNGAGKTTTMRIITGFLPASEGSCTVGGFDISKQSFEARKKIGYLPESTALYADMEVTEYLKYIGQIRNLSTSQINSRLKEVALTCGLEMAFGKKIATLSKGFRQRVGLAQALLHDPEILILDEPTVGLDPNQIIEIRKLIKEIGKQKTILISTHILPEVEQTCERVIIISEGKIVATGTPRELMSETHGVPAYYVGIRGKQTEIENTFKEFPNFQTLEVLESPNGICHIKLLLDSKENQSEEIFKLAVSKKWNLVELKREKPTLEDVFKKLTQ